jgi:hypothetical protein
MSENEILLEIRRIREDHARECGFDVHLMFEQMRAETERLKADGWKVAKPPMVEETCSQIREEPPTP